MGRGLVEPLDLHHRENPPSHPEVMALLVDEFGKHKFDMKWLLRQLARSRTYQRSSRITDDAPFEAASWEPTSYRLAMERALSAEQILASVWQATGPVAEAARESKPDVDSGASENGAAENDTPTDSPKAPAVPTTMDELRERFIAVLGNPPREPEIDINPTVKAALFLMNDDAVLNLLKPGDHNLIARLAALDSIEQIGDELYLSVLSRRPSAEEQVEVSEYLDSHSKHREGALADLAWALLASTEFCINH